MTNKDNTVLYTGITNNLVRRIYEHKNELVSGFTSKYNVKKLVYYEIFEDAPSTIVREKQLKAGSRRKKIWLIENKNPKWDDLGDEF